MHSEMHAPAVHGAEPLVLVVDDDPLLREAIENVLAPRGFKVEPCEDALEALLRLRAGIVPDVILLDLRMPGMDGWEFRVVQKSHDAWSQIPLVALSGDSSPKAAAIDADAFLAKPLCDTSLLETVERLVAAARRRSAAEREADVVRIRDMGRVAAGIAEQITPAVSSLIQSLQLAQRKVEELERAAGGSSAFSLLGVRKLLLSAEHTGERVHGVLHGVALLSEMALYSCQGKRRVLIAHSEPRLSRLLSAALDGDHDVLVVHGGADAARALREESFDAFLCELRLPEEDGIALYEMLLRDRPEQAARVVFLTAGGGFLERERAFFARYRPWQLRPPFHAADIRELIEAHWRSFH